LVASAFTTERIFAQIVCMTAATVAEDTAPVVVVVSVFEVAVRATLAGAFPATAACNALSSYTVSVADMTLP